MNNKKPVGLVVGETAELPASFVKEHDIRVVPFDVRFEEDGNEETARQNFYQKMLQGWHPKTSQPAPGWFAKTFNQALQEFEDVLVVLITAEHSGAVSAAKTAKNAIPQNQQKRIHIFDSRLASVAESLVVQKAQELVDECKTILRILQHLDVFKEQVGLFGLLQDIKWLEEGGRISRLEASAIRASQALGFQATITIKKGKVTKAGFGLKRTGKIGGQKRTPRLMVNAALAELKKRLSPGMATAIGYSDFPKEELERLEKGIEKLDAQIFVTAQVNPVIGTYAGPGCLLVAYA